MHAEAQVPTQRERARLLFVDDEERVLNSMRIMFRRSYDLFTASHGAEALKIVKAQDIDVIVADHRMPQMTGVEVLTAVRTLSPRTVRILLTGYADLDAVEGSINDGEVFRFLTKPCAPQQLRDTIALAATLAREAPAPDTAPDLAGDGSERTAGQNDSGDIEIVLDGDTVREMRGAEPMTAPNHPRPRDHGSTHVIAPKPTAAGPDALAAAAPVGTGRRLAQGLGVTVFSADEDVLETVQKAVRGRVPVHRATNIVQVVKILAEHRPGVLLTDISVDKATIQAMTARLKQHLPELVTIAVSEHRDVLDMVWLINHGQIFRFLRKPLSPGRCAVSLQAALQHHRTLLKNPALVRRHEVDAVESSGLVDGLLTRLKHVKRFWASA